MCVTSPRQYTQKSEALTLINQSIHCVNWLHVHVLGWLAAIFLWSTTSNSKLFLSTNSIFRDGTSGHKTFNQIKYIFLCVITRILVYTSVLTLHWPGLHLRSATYFCDNVSTSLWSILQNTQGQCCKFDCQIASAKSHCGFYFFPIWSIFFFT